MQNCHCRRLQDTSSLHCPPVEVWSEFARDCTCVSLVPRCACCHGRDFGFACVKTIAMCPCIYHFFHVLLSVFTMLLITCALRILRTRVALARVPGRAGLLATHTMSSCKICSVSMLDEFAHMSVPYISYMVPTFVCASTTERIPACSTWRPMLQTIVMTTMMTLQL